MSHSEDDASLDARLAALSPEKRRLFALLQRKRAAPAACASAAGAPPLARLSPERFQMTDGGPPERARLRDFYDAVSQQLDASPFAEHAIFLNYGYVPNDAPQRARVALPDSHLNKNAIRLVLELVGDHELGPEDAVLDVGAGRGGTCVVLRRFFRFGRFTGLDLSPAAVAFSASAHRHPHNEFLVGDAVRLPFADGAFDVVTNVESSHGYGDIPAFFREVARVLRPRGVFLYTDLIPDEHVEGRVRCLRGLGFAVEREEDITANVLLSCDETAATHARAFANDNDRGLMEVFLGMPSSRVYQDMKGGRQRYMLYRLRNAPERPRFGGDEAQ
ncbi:class I SAM-dependent methyltransferase [Sorangium sp. So ce1151]|uniref:class I SAM-dependent methyltransferase n=1 Tax=Sorangium sp. So ce1151 TaxID=3133332 RepID=UPI003F600A96